MKCVCAHEREKERFSHISTAAFSSIHSPQILMQLKPHQILGSLSSSSAPSSSSSLAHLESELRRWREKRNVLPPIDRCLNLFDIENLAKEIMSGERSGEGEGEGGREREGWAYYSSGANDEITLRENRAYVFSHTHSLLSPFSLSLTPLLSLSLSLSLHLPPSHSQCV